MSENSKQGKSNQQQPFLGAFVIVEQAQNVGRKLDLLLAKRGLTPKGMPAVNPPESRRS